MSKQVNTAKIARTEANKRTRAVRHQQRMAAQANKQLTIARGAARSARRAQLAVAALFWSRSNRCLSILSPF